MIAVVESDANDLAGPANRRSQAYRRRYPRRRGSVLLQPGIEFLQTAVPEKRLVIVRAQAGGVNATAIAQKRTRLFFARLAKSNQFHSVDLLNVQRVSRFACSIPLSTRLIIIYRYNTNLSSLPEKFQLLVKENGLMMSKILASLGLCALLSPLALAQATGDRIDLYFDDWHSSSPRTTLGSLQERDIFTRGDPQNPQKKGAVL